MLRDANLADDLPARSYRCPTCGTNFTPPAGLPAPFPFCQERCREVDLGRWFFEKYSVPVVTDRPLRDQPGGGDDAQGE